MADVTWGICPLNLQIGQGFRALPFRPIKGQIQGPQVKSAPHAGTARQRGDLDQASPLSRQDISSTSGHQLNVTAPSSITKDVCNDASSTPVNFNATVVPAYEDRSIVFSA